MTEHERERLETQLVEMWDLIEELEAVSVRLRTAADKAIVSLRERKADDA